MICEEEMERVQSTSALSSRYRMLHLREARYPQMTSGEPMSPPSFAFANVDPVRTSFAAFASLCSVLARLARRSLYSPSCWRRVLRRHGREP